MARDLRRGIGLHIIHNLLDDAPLNVELGAEPVHVSPLQGKQL